MTNAPLACKVELSTWSKEMRAYFEESVQLRNEEQVSQLHVAIAHHPHALILCFQAALIQQEKSAVYNPLHKVVFCDD